VDLLITRAVLYRLRLGGEMKSFARGLEKGVFREARERDEGEVTLAVAPSEDSWSIKILRGNRAGCAFGERRLAEFLGGLGVRTLVLESNLESNQVQDVLELLWQGRRMLRGKCPDAWSRLLGRNKVLAAMASPSGQRISCAIVTFDRDSGRLAMRNTYCPLTFSRAVAAYKRRFSSFNDHRAFFHAAPKFALIMVLLTILPTLAVLFFIENPALTIGVGVAVALVVGFVTYVVFETIGSEEYDKEHQAKEIERRHKALVAAHELIQYDLDRARRIQRMFIPAYNLQPFPSHVSFAHTFVPEMAVGGDYYDLKKLDEDRIAILFADVSGHGMSAAFVTGLIKTTFEFGRLHSRPPNEFVFDLNNVLERFTPTESFAAVIVAVYDKSKRVFTFSNAGHNPPPALLRRDGPQKVQTLMGAINLLAGINPNVRYSLDKVELAPGDKLVFCTDGITDATNNRGEMFGVEGLGGVLEQGVTLSAAKLRDRILTAVVRHVDGAAQNDDQTILIMEVL